jgi:hypothetical protein
MAPPQFEAIIYAEMNSRVKSFFRPFSRWALPAWKKIEFEALRFRFESDRSTSRVMVLDGV